jgi:hypothetical protein
LVLNRGRYVRLPRPPNAELNHGLLGTSPCKPLLLCRQTNQGLSLRSGSPVGLGGGLPWLLLLHSNQGQTFCRICPRFRYNRPRLKGNNIGVKSRQIIENTKSLVRDLSTARQQLSEADILQAIREAKKRGARSLGQIAEYLNEHLETAPRGGSWSPIQVSRVLTQFDHKYAD